MVEITKDIFCSSVFIVLLIIIIFKEYCTDIKIDKKKYTKKEYKYMIKKIKKKNNRTISSKIINSCRSGVIAGSVSGCITGGIIGAITGGTIFGVSNGIVAYINYNSDSDNTDSDEEL
jgi:ligand-binding sensor protein